jgi:monoamine oxidase
MQPGFEAVLTGVPPLFFCGDWTLAGWAGYMEGALRSVQLVSGAVEEYLDHSS